jgi:hypothetical protein
MPAKLERDITIIIGAGANKDIHPDIDTGAELISNISNRVTDRTKPNDPYFSKSFEVFENLGYDIREQFLYHLDNYMRLNTNPSIDAFLDEIETYPEYEKTREQFMRIGTQLNLAHVVGWEGTSTIDNIRDEVAGKRRTWLSVLGEFMDKYDTLSGSKLRIITFNYDRILEKFLYDKYGQKHRDRLRRFFRDDVRHVYGRYGNYPGLIPLNEEVNIKFDDIQEGTVDFDQIKNNDFGKLIHLIENIRLTRQRTSTGEPKYFVSSAGRLIIMGYGMDPINNSRIGLRNFGNDDRDIIFNIYPGPLPSFDFASRRDLAEKVRNLRVDTDIQYMTCTKFLEYALYRE